MPSYCDGVDEQSNDIEAQPVSFVLRFVDDDDFFIFFPELSTRFICVSLVENVINGVKKNVL